MYDQAAIQTIGNLLPIITTCFIAFVALALCIVAKIMR